MGYYVRYLSWKKSLPAWKLQFVSYSREDLDQSKPNQTKKEWDVDPDRWRALGFHKTMSIEDARARAKQLNAQGYIKKQEVQMKKMQDAAFQLQKKYDCVLPEEFVIEFEKRFVKEIDLDVRTGNRRKSQAHATWSAARKMIFKLQVDPSEWFYYHKEIYDYFVQEKLSLRYSHAILRFANLWGFFICRKLLRPFLPVPQPRGYERQRLIDAFYQKDRNCRKASLGLTPEKLSSIKEKINQANFNWLYLSVWLGLRPREIDNLQEKKFWKIETPIVGKKILWVYQTKVVALPPENRWKPIPILFEEQEFALRILEAETFKRPLCKTMRCHFSGEIDLYGGRKGFVDLMISKGHILENISVWMGHGSLERTWRSYKSRRLFHLR